MNVTLKPISPNDREPVIDILNHYIEHSFAAYPERKHPYEFFDAFMHICEWYPAVTARNEQDELVGFGLLRPYSPSPSLAFSGTAEITYFIKPDCTGLGIGRKFLDYLVAQGEEMGLTTILAQISSLNEGSLRFHLRNGFEECGRFRNVGKKRGQTFDVVFCQMML